MIRTVIFAQTTAIALGLLLAQHQPARAGMMPTLETASNGAASWTYTVGASASSFKFSPIVGTDWTGSPSGGTTSSDAVSLVSDPASLPVASGAPASAVPEPGTLALLGFPLLFVAAVVRRRRR